MRKQSGRDSGVAASRRAFLRRGGIVAAGGVAAAAALPMATAGAGVDGPIVPVYLPVLTPTRIYDSRTSGGKLQPGVTRTLTPASLPSYFAMCVNVTATQTENSGYLSVFPGDITWPGTSSVNWFQSNMDIANNALTWLADSNGAIRVFCGGTGATHFVLDLIGIIGGWDTGGSTPASVEDYRTQVADAIAGTGTWTES